MARELNCDQTSLLVATMVAGEITLLKGPLGSGNAALARSFLK